jgi:hypothetical protein
MSKKLYSAISDRAVAAGESDPDRGLFGAVGASHAPGHGSQESAQTDHGMHVASLLVGGGKER